MNTLQLLVSKRITCEEAGYPYHEALYSSVEEYEEVTGDYETFKGKELNKYKDHFCCWEQHQEPACGIPLEKHSFCCICGKFM